jgi:myosin protein heavy chain
VICVLQVELEGTIAALEETEVKATSATKQVNALTGQLQDTQEMLQEETQQKLALQTKARSAEDRCEVLQDQLEEEEDHRKNLEGKINLLNVQVSK